jgi:hypothetical protein
MKKTVSILLVICFLMSVTTAAVSAEPDHAHDQGSHDHHESHEH